MVTKNCLGATLTKMAVLTRGYKILHGGDLDENGNVDEEKLVILVTKFCIGAILTKMSIYRKESSHACL